MMVRTYLLCRWSQVVAGGGGMIAAPTDIQWTWTDTGGGNATAALVSGCAVGADGFQLGAVVSPGDPTANIIGIGTCAGTVVGLFGLSQTVVGAIRWTLGGVPVSGWSTHKTITLTLDPDVATYVANVNGSGFATMDTTTTNALDIFVKGMKSDLIWTKMIEINCVLSIAGAPQPINMAMTLLKIGPNGAPLAGIAWTSTGFVNADVTANGVKGDGASKNAFSLMVPNLTFPSSTNVGLTVYVSQISATANTIDIGAFDVPNTDTLFLSANSFTNHFTGACWNSAGTDAVSVAAPNLNGFYSFSRVAANDIRGFFANSTNAFAQIGSNNVLTGATFGTRALVPWACAAASGVIFDWTDRRLSFIAAHQGLTSAETQSFYNRVQALRVALGGGFA